MCRTRARCRSATCAAAIPPARRHAPPVPSLMSTRTGRDSGRCASGRRSSTRNRPPATRIEETDMSWARKVLRVDLGKGTCSAEPLNMEWAAQYLGQRGLATRYFTAAVDPKVDPLSSANKLIYPTGPLPGTMASTGGRYSVITKGPLTGAIACSNSGGYFGAELKMAGWDMIIFAGSASKPVSLSILDDRAELLDAADLWGKTTWETEPLLQKRHDPQ